MLTQDELDNLLYEIQEIIARLEALGVHTDYEVPASPETMRAMNRRDDNE